MHFHLLLLPIAPDKYHSSYSMRFSQDLLPTNFTDRRLAKCFVIINLPIHFYKNINVPAKQKVIPIHWLSDGFSFNKTLPAKAVKTTAPPVTNGYKIVAGNEDATTS